LNLKTLKLIIMKNLKLLSKIAMAGAFLLLTTHLFAQGTSTQELTMGIPQVMLINAVDGSGNVAAVSLQLTTTTAGDAINGGTATSYAQVSSIIATGQTRNITASVTGVPSGTTLDVLGVTPSSGNGDGSFGSSAGSVTLGTTAVNVFTGIGSCYTGTAAGDGYELDWTWNAGAAGTYSSIVATGGATATVTLTITAGS
jgi:hypothetical protein